MPETGQIASDSKLPSNMPTCAPLWRRKLTSGPDLGSTYRHCYDPNVQTWLRNTCRSLVCVALSVHLSLSPPSRPSLHLSLSPPFQYWQATSEHTAFLSFLPLSSFLLSSFHVTDEERGSVCLLPPPPPAGARARPKSCNRGYINPLAYPQM